MSTTAQRVAPSRKVQPKLVNGYGVVETTYFKCEVIAMFDHRSAAEKFVEQKRKETKHTYFIGKLRFLDNDVRYLPYHGVR